MITTRFLALALVLTAACDQPDDGTDASTGASSTSDAASTGPELDVLAASTGDASTGGDTTGDEGSGGFGGSGGDVCSCDPGQVCATHPVTHEWMCVAPCGPSLVCDPVGVLEFECVTVGGLGLCFPIV